MNIGKIITIPTDYSDFARVRDEYGNSYSIKKGKLPSGASEGDDFPYRVEITNNDNGGAATLIYEKPKD